MRVTVCLLALCLLAVSVYGGQTYRRNVAFYDCATACTDTLTIVEHFPTNKAYVRVWLNANAQSMPLITFGAATVGQLYNPTLRGDVCNENVQLPGVMLFLDESYSPPNTCWRDEMRPLTAFSTTIGGQFSDGAPYVISVQETVDQTVFTFTQWEVVFNYNVAFTGGAVIVPQNIGFQGQFIPVDNVSSGNVINLISSPAVQVNAMVAGENALYYKQLAMSAFGTKKHLIVSARGETQVSIVDHSTSSTQRVELLSGDIAALDESGCQIQRLDSDHSDFDEIEMPYVPEDLTLGNALTRVVISCLSHQYVVEVNEFEGERRLDFHVLNIDVAEEELLDGMLGQSHIFAARDSEKMLGAEHFKVASGLLGGDYQFNRFQ